MNQAASATRRRFWRGSTLAALGVAGCAVPSGLGVASTAPVGSGPTLDGSDYSICLATSEVGVSDRSFNEQAWGALQDAEASYGVSISYLSKSGSIDALQIGEQLASSGDCSMIIGMGYDFTEMVTAQAAAHPEIDFVLVDDTLETPVDNAVSVVFATDEAAFLGGYLAAGVSQTGIVGVYGNQPIPPVQLYMDGYVFGVDEYNEVHDADVSVLGWDPESQTGQFVGSFTDVNQGKIISQSQLQEGADVIFAVSGPIAQGTAVAVREAGGADNGRYMLWVDSDGCVAAPENCDVILSTVEKKIDAAVADIIVQTLGGSFPNGEYVGSLANGGVGLSDFHDLASVVPDDLQTELTDLAEQIASSDLQVGS